MVYIFYYIFKYQFPLRLFYSIISHWKAFPLSPNSLEMLSKMWLLELWHCHSAIT